MHYNKKIKTMVLLLLFSMLLNLILPVSVSATEQDPADDEIPFSCWITIGEATIQGVLSEEDGKYYLNAPAGTVAAEITLNYSGGSMGEGALENAFASGMELTLTGENEKNYTIVFAIAEELEKEFSCWITVGEATIQGVLSEEDGKYYLNAPAGTVAAEITLNYAGGAMGDGFWANAFAENMEITLTGSDEEAVYTVVLFLAQEEPSEAFSCWIVNDEKRINAVLSSEDGKYHMEVPADIDLANTALNFTGVITDTTAGTLGEGVITGAFANATEVTLTGNDTAITYIVVLDPQPVDNRAFSCFTYDEKGNQIDAFWDEKDEIWYLFVPSTVDIADMTVFYTGSITEVSTGGGTN